MNDSNELFDRLRRVPGYLLHDLGCEFIKPLVSLGVLVLVLNVGVVNLVKLFVVDAFGVVPLGDDSAAHFQLIISINNSKLIVLFSGGLSGVIFVDAGDYHKIDDITGEIHEAVQLASISSTGICTCVQNSKHNFQINDIIKLDNLEVKVKNDSNEFSKLNLLQKEWEIESIDKSTFKLKNFSFLNCEIINGTAHYITKPIYIKHESFEKQIKNPNINPNFDMIYSHELISTYLQLFRNNLIDGMPIIWSIENDNFMKDHNICLKDQARIFNLELCPVVSLMGAIVAAETIKLLTNNGKKNEYYNLLL